MVVLDPFDKGADFVSARVVDPDGQTGPSGGVHEVSGSSIVSRRPIGEALSFVVRPVT